MFSNNIGAEFGRDFHMYAQQTHRVLSNVNHAQENTFNYDKGVLAEILEPIMGKGLIPADLETWKVLNYGGLACCVRGCQRLEHKK
jgi:hypothetical protein